MHKQRASALTYESFECVSALASHAKQTFVGCPANACLVFFVFVEFVGKTLSAIALPVKSFVAGAAFYGAPPEAREQPWRVLDCDDFVL